MTDFERALISSLLDVMEHDGKTVQELAHETGFDVELLLDGFSGSRSLTLFEVEAVCVALGLVVTEQIGMIAY